MKHWYLKNLPTSAAILVGILMSLDLHAASNWSKSSWSNDGDSSNLRSVRNRESSSALSDISPFSPGSSNLAVDLGQVFLMGDLGQYSDSIGTQLHYTYGVSDLFAFDASAGYSEHSDGRYSMANLLTGMRLNLSWYDKVIPYTILGLGFYRPNYRDNTGAAAVTNLNGKASNDPSSINAVLFGVHLGPGVDLELSKKLFFGAALTFHSMFGTTKNLANGSPINIGGTYTSFFLHLGTTF